MKAAAVLLICASVAVGHQQAPSRLQDLQDSQDIREPQDIQSLQDIQDPQDPGPQLVKKDHYEEAKKKVKFELSTRENPEEVKTVNIAGHGSMKNFNASRPTKILVHGWHSKRRHMYELRSAVFRGNWSDMDSIFYPGVVAKVQGIARRLADLINHLRESLGVQPEDLHLVGHSLGAHITGLSSLYLTQGTLGRISGLDPAGPLIRDTPRGRLDKSHARFVDVIHTCGNVLGHRDPLGHVDFYPNGGICIQPGCTVLDLTCTCSHNRAYLLFRESILLNHTLLALPSESFRPHDWPCVQVDKQGESLAMGLHTPESARGVYCLTTRGEAPFGLGTNMTMTSRAPRKQAEGELG